MKKILHQIWAVLDEKEKKHFRFLILLDILISIVDIAFLGLLVWIIQFYIQPPTATKLSFLPQWMGSRNSLAMIGIFVFLFALKNLAAFLISRAHYHFTGGMAIRISKSNLERYQQGSFEEFITVDSSVHIRKIAFQPFEFCQYMLTGVQQIITQLCLILIAITAVILFNPVLFLLILCILLPPVVGLFYFMKNRMDGTKKQLRDSNEKSFQYLLDALKGFVEGNIYNRNYFFLQRFLQQRKKFANYLFHSINIQSLPPRIIEVFAVGGLFILIVISRWSSEANMLPLVTVGAFMAAAYKIIPGIVKIINAIGQIKAYSFSVTELVKEDRSSWKNKPQVYPARIDSIEMKEITFRYEGRAVLKDFHLYIRKGDFIGIWGASGKGKTTIFNLLLGFLEPESGTMLFNGNPVQGSAIRFYWSLMAYVRQQSFFIHDSILQNITLDDRDYSKDRLNEALTASGLDKLIHDYPEGLAKIITENGKNISGGQQQRIAIARAVYKNADLILLDEPFNELDDASVAQLLNHFREITALGKTVVMITHDSKSLSWCNKVISLDETE